MRVLAVDTATTSCSVAIVDKTSLLSEFTLYREQTHSKHLMDMIKAALRMSGLNFSDLDGFAVTRGPGSFTGLRIGISTIKGLAVVLEKPVVGVSSLEALALQVSYSRDLICPILDARKGEVYFSRYRFLNGQIILEKMGKFASFAPLIQNTIRASTLAYLSMAKFEKNDTDDIEKISPYYIRKSDAELNLMKS
jgi:tRNA threonylcarbamoyladenosine biosynthesis protein TsaB